MLLKFYHIIYVKNSVKLHPDFTLTLISSSRWFHPQPNFTLPLSTTPQIIKFLPKSEKSFIFWNSEFKFGNGSLYTRSELLHAQYWPILRSPDTLWACSQKINFALTLLNCPIDTIQERPLVPHCHLPCHKLYYEMSIVDKVYSNRNFWNKNFLDSGLSSVMNNWQYICVFILFRIS